MKKERWKGEGKVQLHEGRWEHCPSVEGDIED